MFKPSLLKLIDCTIMPAFLVVGSKAIAFFLLARIFNLNLNFPTDLFSISTGVKQLFSDPDQLVKISSASTLLTWLVILVGFGWVVIKAHHFHSSHLMPKWQQLFHRHGWEHLIQDSHEIYHQAIVWLTLGWAFFFYVTVSTLVGLTAWWVPFIGGVVIISLSAMFIEDVLNERQIIKNNR